MTKGQTITCRHCLNDFCWMGGPKRKFNGIPPEMCSESCVRKNSRKRNPGVMAARRERWLKSKGITAWDYIKSVPSAERSLTRHRQAASHRGRVMETAYHALSNSEKASIDAIYLERDRLNNEAGYIAFHVDHIHPLSKGGLHHPDNLQILSATENLKKGHSL